MGIPPSPEADPGLGVAAVISFGTGKIKLEPPGMCPFIYSLDGEQYVFDGESYGGSVTRSLTPTDGSELQHLQDVDGRYRLLLTNEFDESQHTDSRALLVVDHRPDEQAVLGYDGQPHLFHRVPSPASPRDESGRDLLPFVRAVDAASWTPELISVSDHLPPADVRNHVTLEFRRPPGSSGPGPWPTWPPARRAASRSLRSWGYDELQSQHGSGRWMPALSYSDSKELMTR
jgi:hypothetical protein